MAIHPAPFSDEFAATARGEVDRLSMRAAEVRARAERWIERGEQLLQEAAHLENQVRDLDELLGRAPQLRIDLQTSELQGQQLREVATKLLLERRGTRSPVHYREWYELLLASGLRASGKNGLATFLTQITRSPVVARVSGSTGVYELDPQGALESARAELGAAQRLWNAFRDSATTGVVTDDGQEDLAQAETRLSKARQRFESVLQARSTLFRERLSV